MHCRRAAALANETFIGAERDEMRANLLVAAQDEKLVYLDGPQLETDWTVILGWQKAFAP